MDVTDRQMKKYTISLEYNKWTESEISGWPYCPRPFQNNFSNLKPKWHVAGCYAWSDDKTLNLRLHWVDWISSADIAIRFSGAGSTLTVCPKDTGKGVRTKAFMR